MTVIHLTGPVVLSDDTEVAEAWVVGGRLTLERPQAATGEVTTLAGYVLPGLADAHCHIGLGPNGAVSRDETLAQARTDRASGVLAVRDAGSPADTRWLADQPGLPRVIRAGQHIARPKRYLRYFAVELDNPNDLAAEVARQAGAGDGWVKLVGDWIDRADGDQSDLQPLWTRAQLTDAMTAAHDAGARVTVHTFAAEAIDDLLAAGIDCIEHGTGIEERHLPTLIERKIPVTATLLQIGQFAAIADQGAAKFPVFAARMRRLYDRRYDQVRMLHEAGVQLLVGTDAGGTIGHGAIAAECAEMVAAGIPAGDVVAAASWRGRAAIGAEQIGEGSLADLVVYDRDPRADIADLREPAAVIVGGELVG